MATWFDRAIDMIKRIDEALPAETSLEERQEVIQAHAWRFHGGTSWGQKVWPKAKRHYFATTYKVKSDAQVPAKHLSPLERMMARSVR